MKQNTLKSLRLFILTLFSMVLGACGSSGGSDNAPSGETGSGTVGILLTDAPADPDLFLEVNVSIESIELMSRNENTRETLYSGPTQVINLFDLKNESMPFSFQEGIPSGEYCKIRLTLSDLELVLVDETPEDDTDNETHHPDLPGNNKLDLNIRGCITVESGEMLAIQLDMDAGRSIHISEGGDKYQFRPVVFVDALVEEFEPRLLRLEGELIDYSEVENTLLVCDALPTDGLNNNGCAEIHLNEDTAFFDNILYSGAPRSTDELFEEDNLNTDYTIVGWPKFHAPEYTDIEIPEGHYPPPGECKVWDVRKEPGQQSSPVDCDDIDDELSANFVLVDHDGLVRDLNRPVIIVDALAIEQGEFLQVEGEAIENADETGVAIETQPGSPIIAESLEVSFQEGETGINGTRFVSKTGELLDYTFVVDETSVQVDGVLEVLSESETILKAVLVIIDVEGITEDSVTGVVDTIDDASALITLDSEQVCGVVASQLEMNLNAEFDILTVTITDETSEIDPDGTFEIGQSVGVNGSCDGTTFEVESVVIVNDLRTET